MSPYYLSKFIPPGLEYILLAKCFPSKQYNVQKNHRDSMKAVPWDQLTYHSASCLLLLLKRIGFVAWSGLFLLLVEGWRVTQFKYSTFALEDIVKRDRQYTWEGYLMYTSRRTDYFKLHDCNIIVYMADISSSWEILWMHLLFLISLN